MDPLSTGLLLGLAFGLVPQQTPDPAHKALKPIDVGDHSATTTRPSHTRLADTQSKRTSPADVRAGPPQPTVQRRFAAKSRTAYLHVTGMAHLRNDFYSALGLGFDAGVFPSESLGIEFRVVTLRSRLTATARQVQRDTGLVPDARPQSLWLAGGARYSLGYGKVLLFNRLVVHFDPQFTVHAGIATAETRVLPSVWLGTSVLAHFRFGLQARFDFALAIQTEKRRRGWTTSLGAVPMLSVGWTPHFESKR